MALTALPREEYEAFVQENQGWNFVANLLDLTFYNLAGSFIYGSTVLSVYASHLTDSAALIGLIPAIQNVGYFLPQLLSAQRAEQMWRQKPFILRCSVLERLPYLFVALSCLFWASAPKSVSFAILAGSLALATLTSGYVGPAWNLVVAKVVPLRRRGLFYGLSSALGGLLGVAGATLSRRFLSTYAFPASFGLCFLLCFISHVASWSSFALVREPARAPQSQALPAREYLGRLPGVLRGNPNFCRYLVARSLMVFGNMATALYVVYGKRSFAVTDAFAADLTIAALIAQTAATPLFGILADRRGNKRLTELSGLLGAAALVLMLLARDSMWFFPAFVLMNGGFSSMFVASLGINLEFGGEGNLPTFVALANTLLALPILAAPILGGWLADTIGFGNLFTVALVFSLAGWAAMRFAVRDPRDVQRID